jgi:hypothetical protein
MNQRCGSSGRVPAQTPTTTKKIQYKREIRLLNRQDELEGDEGQQAKETPVQGSGTILGREKSKSKGSGAAGTQDTCWRITEGIREVMGPELTQRALAFILNTMRIQGSTF